MRNNMTMKTPSMGLAMNGMAGMALATGMTMTLMSQGMTPIAIGVTTMGAGMALMILNQLKMSAMIMAMATAMNAKNGAMPQQDTESSKRAA